MNIAHRVMPRRIWVKFLILLPLLFLFILPGDAETILRRTPGTFFWGPKPVWSEAGGGTLFFPFSEPMKSAGLINVRYSIDMFNNSGSCQVRAALRYSDDGLSWDTPKELTGSWKSTTGTVPGTTYTDITALGVTTRSWVQFGMQASSSGASFQICSASLLVEPKEKY